MVKDSSFELNLGIKVTLRLDSLNIRRIDFCLYGPHYCSVFEANFLQKEATKGLDNWHCPCYTASIVN